MSTEWHSISQLSTPLDVELLKPTDDRQQRQVITRWRDEESFGSESFAHGHRAAAEGQGGSADRISSVLAGDWLDPTNQYPADTRSATYPRAHVVRVVGSALRAA